MADETNTGQAPTNDTPPAGQTPDAAATPTEPTPPWGADFDPARAWQTIQSLRESEKEAKRLKKEQEDLAKKLKALEDEKLSDSERTQKRLQELEQKESDWQRERETLAAAQRDQTTRYEVIIAASRAQIDKDGKPVRAAFRDPADAYQMISPSAIEFDDDGRPANIDKLLAALATQKPYLLIESQPATVGVPDTPKATSNGALSEEEKRKQSAGLTSIW